MDKELIKDMVSIKLRVSEHIVSCIPGKIGRLAGDCRTKHMEAAAEAIALYSEKGLEPEAQKKKMEHIQVE